MARYGFMPPADFSLQSAVAAAGTSATTATPLTADVAYITTGFYPGGVQLRLRDTSGRPQTIINNSGALLKVYPPTGGKINGSAVDNAYLLATSAAGTVFHAISDTEYFASKAY